MVMIMGIMGVTNTVSLLGDLNRSMTSVRKVFEIIDSSDKMVVDEGDT